VPADVFEKSVREGMHGNMVQPTTPVGTAASAVRPSEARLTYRKDAHAGRPEPGVVLGNRRQTPSDWIVQNVLDLLIELLGGAEYPIERLCLPYLACSYQGTIDLVSRSALDRIHDFRKREDLVRRIVDLGCKYEVHMIRHDDGGVKLDRCSVVV